MDDSKLADWLMGILIGGMILITAVTLKTAFGLAVKLTMWAMTKLKQVYPQLDSTLIVSASAGGWCVVWLTMMPWLHSLGMTEGEAFWLLLIGGLIWGLVVGHQVEEEISLMQGSLTSPFTQVVDLPPEFYQIDQLPATNRLTDRALTVEQQEARFQQRFQGMREPSRVEVLRHRRLPSTRM